MDARAIALFVESLHNDRPFDEFFKYAKLFDIQPATMLKILYDNISSASEDVKKVVNNFIEETKGELWESEEELLNHYRKNENYEKLKRGEFGGNLIYKYKSYNIVKCGLSWIDFIEDQLFNAIKNKQPNLKSFKEIKSEISKLQSFVSQKLVVY